MILKKSLQFPNVRNAPAFRGKGTTYFDNTKNTIPKNILLRGKIAFFTVLQPKNQKYKTKNEYL